MTAIAILVPGFLIYISMQEAFLSYTDPLQADLRSAGGTSRISPTRNIRLYHLTGSAGTLDREATHLAQGQTVMDHDQSHYPKMQVLRLSANKTSCNAHASNPASFLYSKTALNCNQLTLPQELVLRVLQRSSQVSTAPVQQHDLTSMTGSSAVRKSPLCSTCQ